MKNKRIILIFSSLLMLGACHSSSSSQASSLIENSESSEFISSSSSSEENLSSSESQSSSENQSSSNPIVEVQTIQVIYEKDSFVVGETINYQVKILPQNATNKDYEIVLSNDNVKNENGVLTCEKEGECIIVFKVSDIIKDSKKITIKNESKTIEFINSRLETFSDNEKALNSGGTFNIKKTYDDQASQYTWTTYQNGIKTTYSDGEDSYKEVSYADDNKVYTLLDYKSTNEYLDGVTLEEKDIGEGTLDYSNEEASKKVSMFSLDDNYGVSGYASHVLNNSYLFSSEDSLANMSITSFTSYYLITSSYVAFSYSGASFKTLSMKITYENDLINAFEYEIKEYKSDGYNFDTNEIIDESKYDSYEFVKSTVEYNQRELRDSSNCISVENYQLQDYTPKFETNNLTIGNYYTLSVDEEVPSRHLSTQYSIKEIQDTSIVEKTSDNRIKAKAIGSTSIVVTSSNGIEKTVSVSVSAPAVESISFNFYQTLVSVNIGESINVSATVSPSEAVDTSYTISIVSGEEFAELSKSGETYLLKGLAAGKVTLRATSNANEDIYVEQDVTIKGKPTVDDVKNVLVTSHYSNDYNYIEFFEDGTGNIYLQSRSGYGQYSFSYSITTYNDLFYISFSNCTMITSSEFYEFRNSSSNMISSDYSILSINVYDSWESENTKMTMSR